jgi:hypothetical protein
MTADVKSALDALLPPALLDIADRDEIPLEQDMYRNPHGLGREWTAEQRAVVRRHALQESIYAGVLLVPRERRDDGTIIGTIVQIVLRAAGEEDTPIDQLETALEALWVRVIHAAYGDTQQARLWCAHAAGLLGEIK